MVRYGLKAESKKVLVNRIGELTGQRPRYTYMPRCAYEIGVYTVERSGDLVVNDMDMDETLIQTLLSEGLITEGILEGNCTEEQRAMSNEAVNHDGLVISLPMTRHTSESLRRLVNLIYSRGPLLSKATGGQFGVDKELIHALDKSGSMTRPDAFVTLVRDRGGLTGLSFADDKVNLTGFPLTEDPKKSIAFQQLSYLMNKHVLNQKRIRAKEVNDENEKYAFRIWLMRIGMNGDEYKDSRKILMKNLSGHAAFRTKDEETRWKSHQKEKREELKAAKATIQLKKRPPDAV